MGALIKYISPFALSDNVLAAATDSTNWAINESLIKSVRILTSATDWDLILYCDSDQSSGMFGNVKVGDGLAGDQMILLDIPYVDNDNGGAVHCLFVDNVSTNGATIEVFGQKARTA